jgi:hypothetical protein
MAGWEGTDSMEREAAIFSLAREEEIVSLVEEVRTTSSSAMARKATISHLAVGVSTCAKAIVETDFRAAHRDFE